MTDPSRSEILQKFNHSRHAFDSIIAANAQICRVSYTLIAFEPQFLSKKSKGRGAVEFFRGLWLFGHRKQQQKLTDSKNTVCQLCK